MIQVESVLNISAMVTIAAAVLRLTFQMGTSANTLRGVSEKVDDLVKWKDASNAENALIRVELARISARMEYLEHRVERHEVRKD